MSRLFWCGRSTGGPTTWCKFVATVKYDRPSHLTLARTCRYAPKAMVVDVMHEPGALFPVQDVEQLLEPGSFFEFHR